VFLNLSGLTAVVISDSSSLGQGAEGRIPHLEAAGASIRRVVAMNFLPENLDGASLIVCGTEDEALNARVSEAAHERRIFCNVLDRPPLCSWIAPAMVRRGPLQIAVSTGGQSPALASRIRDAVDQAIGPEYTTLLEMLAALRDRVRERATTPEARAAIFKAMVWGPALGLVREGRVDEAQRVLEEVIWSAVA
jgi:uroporphyrin-III C-methyltransferase/precorrin-2 dehydrogenase/sirohydrochlorin ferrochelatase